MIMRSRSASARRDFAATHRQALSPERETSYGGLVGEMLRQVDARLSAGVVEEAPAVDVPARTDAVHRFSVAAGYVGLLCGVGVAGLFLSWLV